MLRIGGGGYGVRRPTPVRYGSRRSVFADLPPGERIWTFSETKSGTRVTARFDFDADAEHRAPGWLVRLVIARDIARSLKNLRRLAAETLPETVTEKSNAALGLSRVTESA